MSTRTDLERALAGLEPALAGELRRLVRGAGIGNGEDAASAYLARRMAWHLGKMAMPTSPPPVLRGSVTNVAIRELADRRAWELVEANHRRLPPIDWRTAQQEVGADATA